jgi:colicin import membrane protein
VQIGFVTSVLLHVAILAWTLFTFQSQRQLLAPTPEPVAVGMITPNEANKVRQGTPTAKQPEAEAKESPKGEVAKKEAAKARPVAAAPPSPPPPPAEPPAPKAEQKSEDPIAKKLAEAPPPPTPAPPPPEEKKTPDAAEPEKLKADEQRAADALRQAEEARKMEEQKRAEEHKRAEERRRLEEQRQAELKRKEDEKKRREAAAKRKREEEKKRLEAEAAAKSKFDADRIAALLNKVPDKGAPPPSAPPNDPTKAKGPALGAPDGRDKQLSASEKAMLLGMIESRLSGCWSLPSAGGGTDTPVVTLRWRLHPDGSLDGDPVVIEATRNDALFRLAADNAIRAVRKCAPFPLPRDKYDHWKVIIRDFDPSAMLR